ncbi:MAG: hypothetical protein AAF299_08985 [Pseudomonadota bacterium]
MTSYLVEEEQRVEAILEGRNQKIKFEHQEVGDVEEFKDGIFENRIDINPFGLPAYYNMQDNFGAGAFVRANTGAINDAADEFGVDPNMVKAVIYTEMSRGWYDKISPRQSPSVLPGNLKKHWEELIPGSDVNNKSDNIRLTAKLISEIGKRPDEPYPEDIYSLYNGMAHDRTYRNNKTKNTPYFLKQVLKARAWEFDTWKLPNRLDVADINPEDHGFPAGTLVDEQEGSIRGGEESGSAGTRLDRRKIFEKIPDKQAAPDGFVPGKGDLFVPKTDGPADTVNPGMDHGGLQDFAPGSQTARTNSYTSIDGLDINQMVEEVFSSLTLDDWAVIPDDDDPFDGRDPFAGGAGWVPGLGPQPAIP